MTQVTESLPKIYFFLHLIFEFIFLEQIQCYKKNVGFQEKVLWNFIIAWCQRIIWLCIAMLFGHFSHGIFPLAPNCNDSAGFSPPMSETWRDTQLCFSNNRRIWINLFFNHRLNHTAKRWYKKKPWENFFFLFFFSSFLKN